jgi:hypothetical protein
MVDEQVALSDPNNFYHKYHKVELDFKLSLLADDEDEDILILEEIIGKAPIRNVEK